MKVKWIREQAAAEVDIEDASPKWMMPVSNNVRNHRNGKRSLENPEDVVYTTPNGRPGHLPYQPSGFPGGTCRIIGVKAKTDPYTAPYFILTDAEQDTEIWTLDIDGSYGKPTGKMTRDGAFGFHYSTSQTTLGCMRITRRSDAERFAKMVMTELAAGRFPSFTVEGV